MMMKKLFLVLTVALFCGFSAAAQDVIVRHDGTEIEARVTEITPREVRYKRFSNPDGPTYVLPVSGIRFIRYPNGEQDLFGDAEVQSGEPAVSGDNGTAGTGRVSELIPEVIPRDPAEVPAEYVLRSYAVGDYYERGSVRGIVCDLTEDKMHGLLLSLEEVYMPWSTFRKPDLRSVGTTDSTDGEANMRVLERYIADNGLAWSDFPAFEWARRQGEGWYLPAIDELLRICANYNGGSRMINDRQARSKFNDALRENGGKRMDRLGFYFSSTERDEKAAICTHTSLEPPYVEDIPKFTKFLVRAVRKF